MKAGTGYDDYIYILGLQASSKIFLKVQGINLPLYAPEVWFQAIAKGYLQQNLTRNTVSRMAGLWHSLAMFVTRYFWSVLN